MLWHIHVLDFYATLEQYKVVSKVMMWEDLQDTINMYYTLPFVFKKLYTFI